MAAQSRSIWESVVDPWWDAIGLAGAILLGVILFFFPDPATSVLGAIIIVAAALVWLGIDLRQVSEIRPKNVGGDAPPQKLEGSKKPESDLPTLRDHGFLRVLGPLEWTTERRSAPDELILRTPFERVRVSCLFNWALNPTIRREFTFDRWTNS